MSGSLRASMVSGLIVELLGVAVVMIQVELYGGARLLAGRPSLEVEVPGDATVRAVVPALARACPPLVGPVLLPDLSAPVASYTFCLDGRVFVNDLDTPLEPNDVLLLLPAASGG